MNTGMRRTSGKPKRGDWTRAELERDIIGRMKPITLAVDVKIHGKQKIFSMKELEALLDGAKLISKQECECRAKMRNCIEPMDGCLSFDDCAEEEIKSGAKKITKAEALAAMRRTHEAGLVHVAYVFEGKEKPDKVCSCCSCCCHSLGAVVRFGYTGHVVGSGYAAEQNEEKCRDCGVCVERCQFNARTIADGKLRFDPVKCFGCGVCIDACRAGAIGLVRHS
ncbi:MAG: 4Fe-4S binding protein [Methanobacteriota archaeon]